MPEPSASHRKLEKIAGRWEGEEKMYASPWDAKGGSAIGRINSRLALNGFALINDYEQGRRVALYSPTGGIVSLRELPDAIRLAAESAKLPPR